jgi:hypothetical protein
MHVKELLLWLNAIVFSLKPYFDQLKISSVAEISMHMNGLLDS